MRPPYDDFEGFDYADNFAVKKILREQRREERRMSKRRSSGPRDDEFLDDFDDTDSYTRFDDAVDYDDYNEDEFDRYSGLSVDH